MFSRSRTTLTALVAAGVLPLVVAGCTDSNGGDPEPTAATTSAATTPPDAAPTADGTATTSVTQPFGSGCPDLPATGSGSLRDLATKSVVDAAEQVPEVSRLEAAITLAGLRDTLAQPDITVFAPTDAAFGDLSSANLRRLLADPTRVDDVLRYHVVSGRLAPDQLAGSHRTLSGDTLEVTGSGEDFTVADRAQVICGNIQTANATVYLIDNVLQPPS